MPSDPNSGGFLNGLTNVLQSPAVQQLLPAVLGAAGGFLTTPRRAGFGGALGRGLLGASEGMTTGEDAYQNAQHLQLVNQQVQQALEERKKDQPTLAKINQGLFGGPLLQGVLPQDLDLSSLDADTQMNLFKSGTSILEARARGQKTNTQYKVMNIGGKPTLVQFEQDLGSNAPPRQTIMGATYQDPNKIALMKAQIQETKARTTTEQERAGGTLPAPAEAPEKKAEVEAHTRLLKEQLAELQRNKGMTPAQRQTETDRLKTREAKYFDDVMASLHKQYDEDVKTRWLGTKGAPKFEDWVKDQNVEALINQRRGQAGDMYLPMSAMTSEKSAKNYLMSTFRVTEEQAEAWLASQP